MATRKEYFGESFWLKVAGAAVFLFLALALLRLALPMIERGEWLFLFGILLILGVASYIRYRIRFRHLPN